MRVLHVVLSVSRSFGGPARSVQGLVAALCKRGIDAWILPLDNASPWIRGVRKFNQTISNQTIKQFDLVHIHGIWDWRLHKVAVMCRKAGVRYVIAPRGMLEPWSLKQKGLKKRIARWLYQDRDLHCAAALHATAESEAEQFRRLGFKNKIIVSSNGVNVPEGDFGTQVALRHANLAKSDAATTARIAPTPQSAFCQGSFRRVLAEKKAEEWLTEVTFEASTKRGQKKPPQIVSLAEAIRTVVSHQTATGTYPSDENILPNRGPLRNGGCRRALFVSRMHPKKGVLELVESWHRVFHSHPSSPIPHPWLCELVYTVNGAEEKAYGQKVKDRILELGMTYGEMAHGVLSVKSGKDSASPFPAGQSPDFIFTGALDDEKKWNAYARADLFVLPTYSENFGIVVAEALWAGVPVITTKGTPWAELEERKCGWWVDLPGAGKEVKVKGEGEQWNALDDALREAMSLPAASSQNILSDDKYHCSPSPLTFTSLKEMGARGHQLVSERYTWPAVCGKMVRGYEDCLR